ncbi:hypothetical protein NDU88_005328 [Pleurodeles waltl]|uniref:Uncharacterized protein n=1 Tax=Pleurodeles waltl TaxID=8319 RepID=A0AAV7LL63_PLEWA|nr:hypothetical protein NDU88_005328 [Pleurodeles waltl]
MDAAADRLGKLLALLIRKEQDHGPIMELRSAMGNMLHTPQEIHSELTQHYQTLYRSTVTAYPAESTDFFSLIALPQLTED